MHIEACKKVFEQRYFSSDLKLIAEDLQKAASFQISNWISYFQLANAASAVELGRDRYTSICKTGISQQLNLEFSGILDLGFSGN